MDLRLRGMGSHSFWKTVLSRRHRGLRSSYLTMIPRGPLADMRPMRGPLIIWSRDSMGSCETHLERKS
jgi:hypothetical protein